MHLLGVLTRGSRVCGPRPGLATSMTVGVVLALTFSSAAPDPRPAVVVVTQAPADCPDAAFIGVYGTTESPGNSTVISQTYDTFSQNFHGGRPKEIDFSYGTIGISDYFHPDDLAEVDREVTEGASMLDNKVTEYFSCANTTFYLAGYSAGAWLIDKFLSNVGTAVLNRVGGVVLYGDPEDNQSAANGIARVVSVIAVQPMPSDQLGTDRVRSWCLDGDPICGGQGQQDLQARLASGTNCITGALNHSTAPPCAHFDYTHGTTTEGGQFLASLPGRS
jgi:hypothetical protein